MQLTAARLRHIGPRNDPREYGLLMWMKAFTRLSVGLVVVALGASVATTASAAPRPPKAQPVYVALGDSYAAGDGAGSYLSDSTACHRSLLGYPGLVAVKGGLALNLQACSGATTADVLTLQVAALSTTTASYVTITVGGNDVGFGQVMTTCMGSDTAACMAAVLQAEAVATSTLPAQLGEVFSTVKGMVSPTTKVVATSYPRLFNGKDCSFLTDFTAAEMSAINAGTDRLAGVIEAAAGKAGIGYTDVREPFLGHAVCDGVPWVHNAQLSAQYESFHPNADGYRYGYTPTVSTSLGISTTKPIKGKPTVTTGGQNSTDTTRGEVKVAPAQR
jgi:lysophospholipase L1-like esterase